MESPHRINFEMMKVLFATKKARKYLLKRQFWLVAKTRDVEVYYEECKTLLFPLPFCTDLMLRIGKTTTDAKA